MNTQIYEEASEWIVELRAGDVDHGARERLDAWLRASPQHIHAFLELAGLWEEYSDPDLDRHNDQERLLARARDSINVIALESATLPQAPFQSSWAEPRQTQMQIRKRARWRPALAASIFSCAIAFGAYRYIQHGIYTTGVGEQRTVALEDGSSLQLNSRSRVRVRYSEHEREVDLIEGQALFRVAKDVAKPFIVRSDSTRVRAIGTQFDVYRKADGTTITVVEGRVAVYSQQPPSAQPNPIVPEKSASDPNSRVEIPGRATPPSIVLVDSGQQVTATPSAVTQPKHADVSVITAWSHRELVFDSTPLADVALEFNRYNARQLVVHDTQLEQFHVTGIFSSTDPASLVRFLSAQPGIDVEETSSEIRISSK
jgi:transmembrane sensor